jgi:hypothetical protein
VAADDTVLNIVPKKRKNPIKSPFKSYILFVAPYISFPGRLRSLPPSLQEIVTRIAVDTASRVRLEVPPAAVQQVIRLCQSNFENPLK